MIEDVPALVWHMLIDIAVLGIGGMFWRYISGTRKKIDDHLTEASGVKADIGWIKETCGEVKTDLKILDGKFDDHATTKNGH